MKAIVLAAGMGTRLKEHTAGKPKCLVTLNGKPMLEYQIEALRRIADEIVIVRGYMGHLINIEGAKHVDNDEFATTNMVGSLMKARSSFEGDCLVCYSDIVYEPRVLQMVKDTQCSIGVTVDTDFEDYWTERLGDVSSDSESLQIGHDGNITGIGKPNPGREEMNARYVGILKFDQEGTEAFKRIYDANHRKFGDSQDRWYQSKSFRQAYMTDMMQALIDSGSMVKAIPVRRGWLEMDTDEDFMKYHEWIRNGTLRRFCALF